MLEVTFVSFGTLSGCGAEQEGSMVLMGRGRRRFLSLIELRRVQSGLSVKRHFLLSLPATRLLSLPSEQDADVSVKAVVSE